MPARCRRKTLASATRLHPSPLNETPPIVRDDMRRFLIDVRGESIDLKSLGIVRSSLDDVLGELGRIYSAV